MATILCVEDEPDIRHDIVEELQDAGFATIESANGEEALLAVRKYKPDLVLCDIQMPVMSGPELLVAVKENQPEFSGIPFIFLSAFASQEDIVKGKRLGADDYVTKPIDFELLLATVESRLRQVMKLEALRLSKVQAERANRAKSEFLAAMSHELRTPLNAIIGFSEIIKDENFGPVGSTKYRDYAGDINESGQHLLGLVNDILDLSKIESGTDELQEDKIEISEVIRSVLMLVGQRAEQGGSKLELELADQLPALRADERKLKQILVNLLSNAIKFTDAGGKVALRAWSRMGSGHVFQIIDTGIGIAPEDIPKALSQFGQVDGDLDRKYEGTGLGLPLTKALVELHGGTLDLQSQVGVGTSATVRFPAERIVELPRDTESIGTIAKMVG